MEPVKTGRNRKKFSVKLTKMSSGGSNRNYWGKKIPDCRNRNTLLTPFLSFPQAAEAEVRW
jgi:hypothetical protein